MMSKEKVKKVVDGDTFITDRSERIRLVNVNTPEKGHHGAPQARQDLRKLISRRRVNVNVVAFDQYGRAVANVKVGKRSVNKAMKEKGWN
jgi:endonuclease YncB( thermonuclease family)